MPRLLIAALLLAAGAAAALAATSLAAIVDQPRAYAGQPVTVIGTVTAQQLDHAGESIYTLFAEDRRVTVFSRRAAPAPGERLEIDATVGWRAPDEEFSWPPVLLEDARRPAP